MNTEALDRLLTRYQTTSREMILSAQSNDEVRQGLYSLLTEIYQKGSELLGPLTDAQKDYLEGQLLEQIYGNNNPDEDWSLESLVSEFTAGSISAVMLAHRFDLYSGSVRGSLYGAEAVEKPYLLGVRELGPTDDNCIDCLYYASLGPQSLIDVVLPGRACVCFGNCKCRIVVPGLTDRE